MFHLKDSLFSSTVPKLVILDHTATSLCQKLRNFCLDNNFKIGSPTLCQITSISLMPHVRFLWESWPQQEACSICVAPQRAKLNSGAVNILGLMFVGFLIRTLIISYQMEVASLQSLY